uniref:Uncharacterized protein n=1 Tax=Arundo donax TaxID=35708 RepID=A0A0A8ZGB4_ARUDO
MQLLKNFAKKKKRNPLLREWEYEKQKDFMYSLRKL